jgi:predicted nucleotidyltransferase
VSRLGLGESGPSPGISIIFESQACGEATSDSDIALLIIVAQADEPTHRLAQAAYRIATPHSLALELLVMPPCHQLM